MVVLSILIPSVHSRRATFLSKSMESLYGQLEQLPQEQQEQVEILYLVDNKTQYLGQKRNNLIDLAQGEYVVFVDDDDRIVDDYISTLLAATEQNTDIICFQAEVTIDGKDRKICKYSKEYKQDHNTETEYHRIPNHICCVKRSIAIQVSFPNKIYGEDSEYAKGLLPLLQTEHTIPKVLYYYDFNTETTETQQELHQKQKDSRTYDIDVVILSNAKTPELRAITQQTVQTCLETAGSTNIKITVVEQNPKVFYRGARVVQPPQEEFNYNLFLDYGASKGTAKHILFCNNDLIFLPNWSKELLSTKAQVVSPKCPKDIRQKNIVTLSEGYDVPQNFSGWCFMCKRSTWDELPKEAIQKFPFWFADNVVVEELRKLGIKPVLNPKAQVEHLGSKTLKTTSEELQNELTWGYVELFNSIYNTEHFKGNKYYENWLRDNHKKP